MEYEYPIWRIWLEGNDSFKEIAENWTLTEVIKANAILDMKYDIKMANEEANIDE